eukprot:851994-Pyramimonas_sp.AAC.1
MQGPWKAISKLSERGAADESGQGWSPRRQGCKGALGKVARPCYAGWLQDADGTHRDIPMLDVLLGGARLARTCGAPIL